MPCYFPEDVFKKKKEIITGSFCAIISLKNSTNYLESSVICTGDKIFDELRFIGVIVQGKEKL